MALVWISVVGAVAAIYVGGWWVSQPMVAWGRWGFRLALAALLAGLTLPAEAVNAVVDVLSAVLPGLSDISDAPGASFGMHFVLFSSVAGALLVFRWDVKVSVLLAALMGLAVGTEGLQWPIPGRYADGWDVLTNGMGIALGGVIRWGVLHIGLQPRLH